MNHIYIPGSFLDVFWQNDECYRQHKLPFLTVLEDRSFPLKMHQPTLQSCHPPLVHESEVVEPTRFIGSQKFELIEREKKNVIGQIDELKNEHNTNPVY